MRLLSRLKSLVIPKGSRPRAVQFGAYSGVKMDIDLAHRTQLYLGLWERETHAPLREAAARCEWAIDVGAGQGELCLLLLLRSNAKKLYAFEPQVSETDLFRANLKINGLDADPRLSLSNSFVGSGEGSVALDSLDVPRDRPGLMKIDVDGAEVDVLESGAALLAAAPIDMLLETHSLDLENRCLEFLRGRGFACRIIDKAWWRAIIPEQRPIDHNRWIWASRK